MCIEKSEEIKKIFFQIIKLVGSEKYEELKTQKELETIWNEINNLIEKESNEYVRECFLEYFLDKYCVKVLGKNEIGECEIEAEFKNKYGIIITNDIKQNLRYIMKRLEDEINSFVSPEHRILLSKNNEIILAIQELKQEIRNYSGLHETLKDCGDRKTKVYDDYDRYMKLWNSSLFMEDGQNKTLSDIFVETNFRVINIFKKSRKGITNKEQQKKILMAKTPNEEYVLQYLNDYPEDDMPEQALRHYKSDIKMYSNLEEILNKYIKSDKKISLILGLPGSGKSSLVSYLAGKYFEHNKEHIFVRLSKLAKADSLLDAICKYLNVEQEYLENKFLVLDGLDEINFTNDAESLLINFINDIKNLCVNTKIFITVRDNYVDIEDLKYIPYYAQCYIVQIMHFGLMQMIDFHYKYTKENISLQRLRVLQQEKKVLGIPLLLYIVYSLNIDLMNEHDKYRLYQKIFSIQNGIYDKCNTGDGGYDIVGKKFTIEDKESFHAIAQEIAYEMFLKNTLMIMQDDIESQIKESKYTERSKMCYLYNNFYERLDKKIGFIHKSFYEYFLAEYIGNRLNEIYYDNISLDEKYRLMCNLFCIREIGEEVYEHLLIKLEDESYIGTDAYVKFLSKYIVFAMYNGGCNNRREKLGLLRTQAILFFNILKFCTVVSKIRDKYFIDNHEVELPIEELHNICNEIVNIEQQGYLKPRLLDGVFFKGSIGQEINLKVLGFKRDNVNIINIKNSIMIGAKIACMNFINSNLNGMYFLFSTIENCRFEGDNLRNCDFRRCEISRTQFINGIFENANFRYAILRDVNFRGTNLNGTDFSNSTLDMVEFDEENVGAIINANIQKSHIRVYMKKTRKTITFEEYMRLENKSLYI